jgi:hypothetical protein
MSLISVKVEEARYKASVLRRMTASGIEGLHGPVWWEISGDRLPPPLTSQDLALVAVIFPAMRQGSDVYVDGPVSWSLLTRLEQFQSAWAKLLPDRYRRVGVSARAVVNGEGLRRRDAVVLFSGGVDSTFTLWRHHGNHLGPASRPIVLGLFIHGFDIPLDAEKAFLEAAHNARQTLSAIGVPLALVRTNWRDTCCLDWEREHGAGMTTCLWQYRGAVGAGLVASGPDYANITRTWGSNPTTDPLLSSDDFELVHDGAGFSRTEKVAMIAEWRIAADRLRVCWEGEMTGRNCGRCEKCTRTKLNFMAAGKRLPSSLPEPPTALRILALETFNLEQFRQLQDILNMARENRVRSAWVTYLDLAIRKNAITMPVKRFVLHVPTLRKAARVARARLAAMRTLLTFARRPGRSWTGHRSRQNQVTGAPSRAVPATRSTGLTRVNESISLRSLVDGRGSPGR